MSLTTSSILCRLLRESDDTMDAILNFPSECNQKLKAHKAILAAWSPIFRALFYEKLNEKTEVDVVDIKVPTFQKILGAMYAEVPKFNSVQEAIDVFHAADKYNIAMIEPDVENYLISTVSFTKFFEIFEAVESIQLTKVEEACLSFFKLNTNWAINHEQFLKLSANIINKLYAVDRVIDATELELYKALEKWGDINSGQISDVRPALQNIRFLGITPAEVCKLKLLTSDEKLAIVYNILTPNSMDVPFPTHFSTKPSRWNVTFEPCLDKSFSFGLPSTKK